MSLSFIRFSPDIPRSYSTPVELKKRHHQCAQSNAAFPVTLAGRLPQRFSDGAVSILGSLRDSLRSVWFPVYASLVLFRHPSHPAGGPGSSLVTRCLPRIFNDLANMSAKLGNYFWLGFIIAGLSPNKKRHAWHGAQRPRSGAACLAAPPRMHTG